MESGPRRGIQRILADLGTTVLELAASPGPPPAGGAALSMDAEVTGVTIYDPLDELLVAPGGLLLGVGVDGTENIVKLLGALGSSSAAGLVVKAPVAVDDKIRAAVTDTGVTLLGLNRAASWSQVAALLRSILAEGEVRTVGGDTDDTEGDLFSLANAVSALLDAPVTIEDNSSRVLAFSSGQDEADPGRIETVLGRQVPEHYRRMLEERGIFRRLYQETAPIYMELGGTLIPRVAVAVRAGDEILGSMWAAVHERLPAERSHAFSEAAKTVALHLLRRRAGANAHRRLGADLLSTMLAGGHSAAEAAARLGIADESLCVLAAEPADETGGAAEREMDRQRLADALVLHLSSIHPRAAAAAIGGTVYAVLPMPAAWDCATAAPKGESRAIGVAENFLARTGRRRAANIGVGRLATSLPAVTRSRTDADRALRVLRSRPAAGIAVGYSAVHVESLLLQLADLVAAEAQPPSGPYQKLADYDATHGANLLATLRSYLDSFGDVAAAATTIHVHPNTFRYRLRRLTEIAGLDLGDPDARLSIELDLRLHRGRG